MKILSLFLTLLFIVSCNKLDPNPELRDPIYGDLNSRKASLSSLIETEKKTLLEHEKTLKEVVPQTGQIKYATKRVYESQAKIARMEQELAYTILRISSRKKQAGQSYKKAYAKGEEWPDKRDWTRYQAEIRLRESKSTWNTKMRVEEFSSKMEKGTKEANPAPAAH